MSEDQSLEHYRKRLADVGLKWTRQREVVIRTFVSVRRHISVDDLLAEVRRERPRTGHATVYRTLRLLVELGLAHERNFGSADAATLYEPALGTSEHFHLLCTSCGAIVEFEADDLAQRHRQIAREHGLRWLGQRLEIYAECVDGSCPNHGRRRRTGG